MNESTFFKHLNKKIWYTIVSFPHVAIAQYYLAYTSYIANYYTLQNSTTEL